QAEAERDWDKVIKCAKVGSKVAASFVREFVPELRTYMNCVDYTPIPNARRGVLKYVRCAYELLRQSVNGNTNCLIDPLKRGIDFLKPNIAQIDELKCLEE
ncbi:hypothetical protein KR054_004360, partial [Drosophila jambulina]